MSALLAWVALAAGLLTLLVVGTRLLRTHRQAQQATRARLARRHHGGR